ncbi:MAG TPA: hypothetical protein VHW70_02520 [Edaphobacter sp.]|nr:hypothetical protein [Edaphobacter sp.]
MANVSGRRIVAPGGRGAGVKAASVAKKPSKGAGGTGSSTGAKKTSRVARRRTVYAADHGQMTAFHHMQRASVVMSLMEKGTGKDLRRLLEQGVKLYRRAMEEEVKEKTVLRAIGVLRAVEHLSMAGLYAARRKHRQKVAPPTPEWLGKVIAEIDHRLEQMENRQRGKGTDLFPVTVKLLREAADRDLDAHLAFELAMAADALCFALENGL